MIEFKCQCGQQFSEPEDHAGLEFQCPQCLRLVDVPRLSDLAAIAPDGTYVLTHPAPPPDDVIPGIDDVVHAFRRGTIDAQGAEIDLRQDNESLANVGSLSLAHLESVVPPPPRYDPETGELLTPVDITPHVVRPIPIIDPRAASTLKYAVPAKDPNAVHIWRVPGELLKVTNLAVMAFPFFTLIVLAFVFAALASAMAFPLGMAILAGLAIFSHLASVPRDMGYNERDDLPRPLGDLDWLEDLFIPLGNLLIAMMICYWPGVIVEHHRHQLPHPLLATFVVATAGNFLFPAIFLTTTNSGSFLNLRPDRVLGVIRAMGWFYLVLVGEWMLAPALYSASFGALLIAAFGTIYHHAPHWWLPVAVSALAVAIYIMYLFLWQLGLAYRKWGDQFPWVFQQHMR